MAALVASDVTYTALDPVEGVKTDNGRTRRVFALTTAAGDYATGGIPLDNDMMGCPNVLESLVVMESNIAAVTHSYKWDKSANTLMVIVDHGTTGVPAQHGAATFTSPNQLVIEVVGW